MNFNKKRIFILSLVAVMCALSILPNVLAGENAPEPVSESVANTVYEPTTVTVSGAASVSIRPDIAYLYAGVTTEDKEASVAQNKNSQKTASVIAKLVELGIAEDDISTESISIYPNYDYSNPSAQAIIGYNANQTMKITVRDIDTIGKILDEIVSAGANQVNNVEFAVDDRSAAYDQAMTLAVKNAEAKAATLAAAAGKSVTRMASIVEDANYYGTYYAKGAMYDGAVPEAETQVMPSWVNVSANLTIVFEME